MIHQYLNLIIHFLKKKFKSLYYLKYLTLVDKAADKYLNVPIYCYLEGINCKDIPTPYMNVINDGTNAYLTIDIQEFYYSS